MTAQEFLISKGVLSLKESYSVYQIQKWLEEYSDYRENQIFKQSIDVQQFQGTYKFIKLSEYREEIMQSIN